MSNYNDKEFDETEETFAQRMKRWFSNRAVMVTALTLLLAASILIAVTVSANRAKQPSPDGQGREPAVTDTDTESDTLGQGQETLPGYNDGGTEPVGNEPETPTYTLPVTGHLIKAHDPTVQVYSNTMGDYRVHLGLDIATEISAPVCAVADGTVSRVWEDSLMGMCVAVKHDGDVLSVYKNLSKTLAEGIEEGTAVKSGQTLGTVGDTAMLEMADDPHLHLEMTVGGISADPLDYFSAEDVATLKKDTAFEATDAETTGR